MGEKPRDAVNRRAVEAYSTLAAAHYEDPVNHAFLYGGMTQGFLREVTFRPTDRRILDVGCGTGVVFSALEEAFRRLGMDGIGLDPAAGMLAIAREKFQAHPRFRFIQGAFEGIPLATASVDRILSTLVLHWVGQPHLAVAEIGRVLRPHGQADLLMVAREDGRGFKRAVHRVLKTYLPYAQLRRSAQVMQRFSAVECRALFAPLEDRFQVSVEERRGVIHGSVDDHLKWWLARAAPVVAELPQQVRPAFLDDLHRALVGMDEGQGRIPFDSVLLVIRVGGRG